MSAYTTFPSCTVTLELSICLLADVLLHYCGLSLYNSGYGFLCTSAPSNEMSLK